MMSAYGVGNMQDAQNTVFLDKNIFLVKNTISR